MKVCSRCDVTKELDQFWFDKKRGRHVSACRSCVAVYREHYRKLNAGRLRIKNREWQRRNTDKMRTYHLRWVAKQPITWAERSARWRANNLEKARAMDRAGHAKLKRAAYEAYGGFACKCCGEVIEKFLTIDHVANDGADHRKQMRGKHLYRWLRKNGYPQDFQVLCMNCNFGKARNGGVCPHVSPRVPYSRGDYTENAV